MRKLKEQLAACWHYLKKQTSRFTAWMILSPIRFFIAAILLIVPLIFILDLFWLKAAGGFGGVLIEAHGLVFDLIVFGVIAALYEHYRQQHENAKKAEIEKQQRIERYQEEIDDFRGWEGKEASYRIAGNIRRLIEEGVLEIDLSNCFLKKANLEGIALEKANLVSVSLIGANLRNAKLPHAHLDGGYLRNANLNGVDLNHAILCFADLTQTQLMEADLTSANLYKSVLINTFLRKAKLIKADLTQAKLIETYLFEADLTGADLTYASLINVTLDKTKGLSVEMLKSCYTLYQSEKWIPENMLSQLKKEKPELFERPKDYDELIKSIQLQP